MGREREARKPKKKGVRLRNQEFLHGAKKETREMALARCCFPKVGGRQGGGRSTLTERAGREP